jgi:hypothetical protein
MLLPHCKPLSCSPPISLTTARRCGLYILLLPLDLPYDFGSIGLIVFEKHIVFSTVEDTLWENTPEVEKQAELRAVCAQPSQAVGAYLSE